MKIVDLFSKRGYLIATIKAALLFLVIGPIHELVHALVALMLGGKVANISFIPNGFGNLTTIVQIEGYFKQILVAISPGIILGALGIYVSKKSFEMLKHELNNSNKINPKIYSNILKLTIGLVALVPLVYGLINFAGALLGAPQFYTGDFTTGAFALENGLKQGNQAIYDIYNLFPESTRILLVALFTTLFAFLFYEFLGFAFKYAALAYTKVLKRSKLPRIKKIKITQ